MESVRVSKVTREVIIFPVATSSLVYLIEDRERISLSLRAIQQSIEDGNEGKQFGRRVLVL